jgi:hypothetical protein
MSGTLSVVDDAALFQYACLFAETEEIAARQAHTATLVDKLEVAIDGTEERPGLAGSELTSAIQAIAKLKALESAYSGHIRAGRMALRQYLVEFGMTPASRSKVVVPKSEKDESIESALH